MKLKYASRGRPRYGRAKRVDPIELRRTIWHRYGHRSAFVRVEKKKNRMVIHITVKSLPQSLFKQLCRWLDEYEELTDYGEDKQVINVIRS